MTNGLGNQTAPEFDPGADLVSVFERVAHRNTDRPALTFLDYANGGTGEPVTHSYGELVERAKAVAAQLQQRCSPGSRVAILCPHNDNYVVASLAGLYAGLVFVPLYAPETLRSNDRLRTVLGDSSPEWVLTTTASRADVLAVHQEYRLPLKGILCVDEVPARLGREWQHHYVDGRDVAYLQYTSGSTSRPSGVLITHANVQAAVSQVQLGSRWLNAQSILVNWVPYFHDMGLITGVLTPLILGAHALHLSPTAFIQDPGRWLRAISEYRASWTASPNFGLELCVRRIKPEQRDALDLRSLWGLLNGSETVRGRSVAKFQEYFRSAGLATDVVGSGYGLAEATLGVTAVPGDEEGCEAESGVVTTFDRSALSGNVVRRCRDDSPEAVQIASCGIPLEGVDVRIVAAEDGSELPSDRVGEIWVSGPNVAEGYWRQDERTAEVFGGKLIGRDGVPVHGKWLRTGDLGFVDGGRLFVVGRLKDVINIGGSNHYATDVESTVESAHHAVCASGVAAFAVDVDHAEELVVVTELGRDAVRRNVSLHEVQTAIRRDVSVRHGIEAADTVLVRQGTIPRTTSRKIQRGDCKRQYFLGELRRVVSKE